MIYWLCFLCHVFADFWFQIGCHLNDFKRKLWWDAQLESMEFHETLNGRTIEEKEADDRARRKKYKNDYHIAMLLHAFSWSIITFLPLLIVYYGKFGKYDWGMTVVICINTMIHSWIDHAKCNTQTINLLTDQILHYVQIVATILIVAVFCGG